ncbi:hypothetical protein E1286_19050 [Nonomuraea terrae]|uniref:Uncharacterized protein n=1 Tax=Nonomuraea terrae TaxID=2530383 RepID=A0A4R4YRS6_9ACTN|nr:hypothetical protein E1286_19050 [Nonomuraea terrae]
MSPSGEHLPDGVATSSVSAPWLRAEMLEAARLTRGARVPAASEETRTPGRPITEDELHPCSA